jgi:preprotein translocase subunit Sss1
MDYTKEEYNTALKKVSDNLKECNNKQKIKDTGTIEFLPEEVHWIGEEWSDIVRDFHNQNESLSLTRWSQVVRVTEKPKGKEWKKYTFKSSGRVILYKWDTYGNSYYNVTDPFRL